MVTSKTGPTSWWRRTTTSFPAPMPRRSGAQARNWSTWRRNVGEVKQPYWRALVVVIPLVATAACGPSHVSSSGHHGGAGAGATTTSAPQSVSTSTPPSTALSSTTVAAPTTVAGGSSTSPSNLTITSSDVAALTTAFAAYTHVPVGDISGVESGSVYMAEAPASGAFWAL